MRQEVTLKLYKRKVIYFGKIPLITFSFNQTRGIKAIVLNIRFDNCHFHRDERRDRYLKELLKLHKSSAFQYKM